MPTIRIDYINRDSWQSVLIQRLESTVGHRTNFDSGAGWRFKYLESTGKVPRPHQRLHWEEEDGFRHAYYLIEIDDPKLATLFALKYT